MAIAIFDRQLLGYIGNHDIRVPHKTGNLAVPQSPIAQESGYEDD
jgi:hypothetical protein